MQRGGVGGLDAPAWPSGCPSPRCAPEHGLGFGKPVLCGARPPARARVLLFDCFLTQKCTFRGAKAELERNKGRVVSARHGRSACVIGSPIGGLEFSTDCWGGFRREKFLYLTCDTARGQRWDCACATRQTHQEALALASATPVQPSLCAPPSVGHCLSSGVPMTDFTYFFTHRNR